MEEKEYTVDLGDVVEILKENRKPIAKITGCTILIGIVFLLIAWFFFPTYESETLLQIRQKNRNSGLASLLVGMGSADFLSPDSSSMDSYIEILKSRSVVVPVIEATEEANSSGKYPDYRKYVEKRIRAEAAKSTGGLNMSSSNILMISVKAKTPEKAQRINQLLLEGFLTKITELNRTEKGSIKQYLEKQLKISKEDLNKAEIALQKFKEENKILSPSSNAEIFVGRIMEVEKQAAANKVDMEAAQARLASINDLLNGRGAANANNQTVQQYQSELAKLETTRISYLDKYTEKHPRMIEINERINNLKTKIQEEIAKIAALQAPSDNAVHQELVGKKYATEGAVTVTRQKAEALQRIIDQNNAELAKMPALEQQYVRLSRNYSVANEIFMLLTKQMEQTKITELQEPTNVLVVDPPHLPDKPVSPKRGVVLILVTLFGLLGSCGYVVVTGLLHKVIRKEEDVEHFLGLSVLGWIPCEVGNSRLEDNKLNYPAWIKQLKEYIWKK